MCLGVDICVFVGCVGNIDCIVDDYCVGIFNFFFLGRVGINESVYKNFFFIILVVVDINFIYYYGS